MIPAVEVAPLVADWRFREGFRSGVICGYRLGWDASERDLRERWLPAVERVRRVADAPTWEALQHRRADRSGARPVPTREEALASWGVDE